MKDNSLLETPAAASIAASIMGRIGGRSRSPKKLAALKKNRVKARAARMKRVA